MEISHDRFSKETFHLYSYMLTITLGSKSHFSRKVNFNISFF